MERTLYGLGFASMIALVGCTSDPAAGYLAPLCASDGSCPGTAACVMGICHDSCAADADCPPSAVCRAGLCWAGASGTCTSDADCAAGESCVGGSCATPPSPIGCASDADCPMGTSCSGGSCTARPSVEVCGNGIDDDLDGAVDEGCTAACTTDADCSAGERCTMGACSGTDADGDGHDASTDCDDTDPSIYPGATDLCDSVDNDCDGTVDEDCAGGPCTADADCASGESCVRGLCTGSPSGGPDADGDGYPASSDCNDADSTIYPGATETCNGVDDDCDGVVDPGCPMTTACASDADCASGQVCLRGTCMAP